MENGKRPWLFYGKVNVQLRYHFIIMNSMRSFCLFVCLFCFSFCVFLDEFIQEGSKTLPLHGASRRFECETEIEAVRTGHITSMSHSIIHWVLSW